MATTQGLSFLCLSQITREIYEKLETQEKRSQKRERAKQICKENKICNYSKCDKKKFNQKDTAHVQRVQINRQKMHDIKYQLEGLTDLNPMNMLNFLLPGQEQNLNDMTTAVATSNTADEVANAAAILATGAVKSTLGLTSNVANIARIINGTKDIVDTLPSIATDAKEIVDSAADAINDLKSLLSAGAANTQNAILNLLISLPNVTQGSILMFTVVEAIRFFHNLLPGLMAKITSKLFEFVTGLGDRLMSLQVRETSVTLESNDEGNESEARGFLNACCSYVTYMLFGSDNNNKSMARQIKHYKEMALSFTAISAALACGSKLLHWFFVDTLPNVFAKLYKWFGMKNTVTKITTKGQVKEIDCADIVSRIYVATEFDPKKFMNPEYCQEIRDLYDVTGAISSAIVKEELKFTPGQLSTLITACRDLRTFFRANINMLKGVLDVERPTPFAIDFAGKSGVGKSTIMSTMVKFLLNPKICVKYYEPDLKHVYTMSDTNFMDGYVGQPVTIVDDLYSLKEGSNDPSTNEYLKMLKLKSNVSVYTNQAALDWKGLPYTCDLFMGSTNTPYPVVNNMNNQKAIWRRRNFLWYVMRKENLWKDEGPFSMFNSIGFFKLDPLCNKDYSKILELEAKVLRGEGDLPPNLLSFKQMFVETAKAFNAHLEKPDAEFLGLEMNDEQIMAVQGEIRRHTKMHKNCMDALACEVAAFKAEEIASRTQLECKIDDYIGIDHYPVKCHVADDENMCCAPEFYKCDEHMMGDGCVYSMDMFVRCYDDALGTFFNFNGKLPYIYWNQLNRQLKIVVKAMYQTGILQRPNCDSVDYGRCWDQYVHSRGSWAELTCKMDPEHLRDGFDEEYPMVYDDVDDFASDSGEEELDHDLHVDNDGNQLEGLMDYTPSYILELMKGYLNGNIDFVLDGSLPKCFVYACAGVAVLSGLFASYKIVQKMWEYLTPKTKPTSSPQETLNACHERLLNDAYHWLKKDFDIAVNIVYNAKQSGLSQQEAYQAAYAVFYGQGSGYALEASNPHAYDGNKKLRPNKRAVRLTKEDINQIVLEAYVDTQNFESVINTVAHNMVSIQLTNQINIQGLGLYDHKLLVPKHFDILCKPYVVDGYVPCIIHMGGAKHKTTISLNNSINLGEWEQLIVEVGNAMPLFKNITKHIQKSDEVLRTEGHYLYITNGKDGVQVRQRAYGVLAESIIIPPDPTLNVNQYVLPRHYQLRDLWFGPGYCGSICFNLETGKVAGLHVGGNAKEKHTLMAPMVSDLYGKQEKFNDATLEAAIDLVDERREPTLIARGSNECIGVVPTEYFQMPPQGTKIKPTIFQDYELGPLFPVIKEPSVMSLKDERVDPEVVAIGDQPLQKGLDKSNEAAIPFADDALEFATNGIVRYMKQYMTGQIIPRRLLTMHEIINGVVGMPGEGRIYDGMDMQTSPGLPYRAEGIKLAAKYKLTGKMVWFENDLPGPSGENMYKLRPTLDGIDTGNLVMKRYNEAKEHLLNGDVPFFVAAMNLKVETLKLSKIKTADTRTFESFPIHIAMLVREYFGSWIASMQANCVQHPISVGIAAQNIDWSMFATRLNRFDGSVIAGDYKKWDGKVMPIVLQKCADIVSAWYDDGEVNARARRILLYTHSHTYMASANGLFRRHTGISSGSPITSPVNSLANWVYIYSCIYEICQFRDVELTYEKLYRNTELAFYGDDHVVAIGPELKGVVTFRDFYNIFNKLGIGYTDSSKSDNIEFDYEKLEDITYLKRSFVKDGMYWLAPLSMDSITSMPLWYEAKQNMTSVEAVDQIKNSYCDELVLHGRTIYNTYVDKWNDYLQKLLSQGKLANILPTDVPFINDTYEIKYKKITTCRGQQ